jgi:hypothetical protein
MTIFYQGYEIDPETGIVYGRRGQPMTAVSRGYIKVNHGQSRFFRTAHRMVWEAVNGPIPDGMQINHKNGNKQDNRICNLEVVTPSENTRHAFRTGLARADGERNGRRIGKQRRLAREAVA